jgi:hypothetical protein
VRDEEERVGGGGEGITIDIIFNNTNKRSKNLKKNQKIR